VRSLYWKMVSSRVGNGTTHQRINFLVGAFATGVAILCVFKGIAATEGFLSIGNPPLAGDREWVKSLLMALRYQLWIVIAYLLSLIGFIRPERAKGVPGYIGFFTAAAIFYSYSDWSVYQIYTTASPNEPIDLLPQLFLIGLPKPWNYYLGIMSLLCALWGAASITAIVFLHRSKKGME